MAALSNPSDSIILPFSSPSVLILSSNKTLRGQGKKTTDIRYKMGSQCWDLLRMAIQLSVFSVGGLLLLVFFVIALISVFNERQKPNNAEHNGAKSSLLQHVTQFVCGSPSLSLPGPPSYFLLGNMMELAHDHLPMHLTSLAQRYGSIYRLRCGNTTIVVLSSSEVIREALVKKWSDFAGRPDSYTGNIVSGGGCSISLGDYTEVWRAHRRLVHSALQRCCQKSLHELIERHALRLRKVLMEYKGTAVDLSEDFTVAASNVITTLAFGKEYDKSSPELQQLHSCLNEIVALWGSSWISALDSFPLLRKLPNPVFARLLKEVVRRDDIIQKHLNDYKSLEKKNEDAITGSLLHGLEQNTGLTDTHVHMATVDLLIGGTETTAAWLNWTIAFLLHRPEVQSRVYEELCTVLDGQYPKYSDRHRLPVLSALVHEVLRLRPVAPLAVPHRAIRDSSIAGYFIPKNTVIIPNLFGAHHDPSVWPDPYSFRPERFLEGGGSTRALVPFGGGARLCLGESVAKMELFLFTAYLLRDFQFVLPDQVPAPDLKGVASVVLKTKPFKVIAVPRLGHFS